MIDYCVWGRIEQVGPQEFSVTVSAVPQPPAPLLEGADVESTVVNSRPEAVEACARLVLALSDSVRKRGDRVVDAGMG